MLTLATGKIATGRDETAAAMAKELDMLRTTFPDLITKTYFRGAAVATEAAPTGMGADLTDKGLGEVVPLPAYNDAKDHFTYVPGGHLG